MTHGRYKVRNISAFFAIVCLQVRNYYDTLTDVLSLKND